MEIEEELRRVLLNLIGTGLLRIRMCGWNGQAEHCAIEADHLHNIPGIAINPKIELVSYYYNTERPCFLKRALNTEEFESDWTRLGEILAEMQSKGAR